MERWTKALITLVLTMALLVVAGGCGNGNNGGKWDSMTGCTTNGLIGVWGSSASDVFAVGVSGAILHYNGNSWREWSEQLIATDTAIASIWGTSSTNVFAGAWNSIIQYDGGTWNEMSSYSNRTRIGSIWGSSPSDIYALGAIIPAKLTSNPLEGFEGFILHYDGNTWIKVEEGLINVPVDIWGSSSSNVFMVEAYWDNALNHIVSTILHYDGNTWSEMESDITPLNGIWGSSSSDVFAVGDEGIILHYDGSAWSEMEGSLSGDLMDVWGSSSSDVFTVGYNNNDYDYDPETNNGIILHYDGDSWSEMEDSTTSPLYGIWGSSAYDVFAVGYDNYYNDDSETYVTDVGTILHYDGSSWDRMN